MANVIQRDSNEISLDEVRRQREMYLNAKECAYSTWLQSKNALSCLDETADDKIVKLCQAAQEAAWQVYNALVLETEWS